MALALKPQRPKRTPTRWQFRGRGLSYWDGLIRLLHKGSVWGESPLHDALSDVWDAFVSLKAGGRFSNNAVIAFGALC
jgi:hypothetical protein